MERFESCDMKWETRSVRASAAQSPRRHRADVSLPLQNLLATLHNVMACVTDTELPVRIQAAIALPELVRYDDIRASMVPNIGRIIQGTLGSDRWTCSASHLL